MYKLTGKVQHYGWGGLDFIPGLLGTDNHERKPFAELWMGAHSGGPSLLELDDHSAISLDEYIRKDPQRILGKKVWEQFGELPFLFKVLDVKEMLSIQVHPTKEEAVKGFNRENEIGIAIDAPHRNYRDSNHKPEVMIALSDFWLLHGFKSQEKLLAQLSESLTFLPLRLEFVKNGYYGLYKYVMEMPQEEINAILGPLIDQVMPEFHSNRLSKFDPAYWVAKASLDRNPNSDIDRGIFSIYFFNLLYLKPGQAIFQAAGVPHAYLEGQNIELMSNSDNVLRGGLTPKHVDVPELLKHTLFEGVDPFVMNGESQKTGEVLYKCPVPDFIVSRIKLAGNSSYLHKTSSIEILILIHGAATFRTKEKELHLRRGEAVLFAADEQYSIEQDGTVEIFKAGVPG